jgi:hypothetical protein
MNNQPSIGHMTLDPYGGASQLFMRVAFANLGGPATEEI